MKKFRNIFTVLFLSAGLVFSQQTRYIRLNYETKRLPFGLNQKISKEQPKLAVVLSGGGARGLSQLGLLRALEENNIPIGYIVGTSMGSIVGGLYSAGYSLNELDSIFNVVPWKDIMALGKEASRNELYVDQKVTEDKAAVELRLDGLKPLLPTAMNSGQKLSNYLNLLTLNAPIHAKNFCELKYNYRAVCTDLVTGKSVVLSTGALNQAMRASAGISPLFVPVKMDSMLLVDGGLVANIPVKYAQNLGGDYIVAFNTTSPLNTAEELDQPLEVADQLMSIPIQILQQQQLSLADLVIKPALGKKKNTDFTEIDSLIETGYNASVPCIPVIKKRLDEIAGQKYGNKFFLKNVSASDKMSLEGEKYISKYVSQDSVSNFEISRDLNELFSSGDYDSVYAAVYTAGDSSHINIYALKNPLISTVEISGITILDMSKVYSTIGSLFYQPYNSGKIFNALTRILHLYRTKGYSLAEPEEIYFDRNTGVLRIRFSEGVISSINVEGNKKTQPQIIFREFSLKAGDFYLSSKVASGLASIRATNLFDDVNLIVDKHSDENSITIKVTERPTSLLRVGLRVDNENYTQINLDIREENLFGSGTELGAIIAGGLRNKIYIIEHKANRIFDTYFTYKMRAFFDMTDIYNYQENTSSAENALLRGEGGEYRQTNFGLSLGVGTQIKKFGTLIVEGKFREAEINNKRNYTENLYKTHIASVILQSNIDSQDDYPFPKNGFLINTSYETAQSLFGTKVGYTKFSFDYISHFTFHNIHTLSPRFVIGFADETLPLSEQFSLGGQNSFFGFRDNEFRGRQIMLASLQYMVRLPVKLYFDAYLKIRYDLGSMWAKREQIRFTDLKHGAGASLAMDTPIGPADFSIGKSFIFNNTAGRAVLFGPLYFYFTIGYYY